MISAFRTALFALICLALIACRKQGYAPHETYQVPEVLPTATSEELSVQERSTQLASPTLPTTTQPLSRQPSTVTERASPLVLRAEEDLMPLGKLATQADESMLKLTTLADGVDDGSRIYKRLGESLPAVKITNAVQRAEHRFVLVEIERCQEPEIVGPNIVLLRCFTPAGVSMGVVGGGDEQRTYEQLRSVRGSDTYFAIGSIYVGDSGGLFLTLY